MRFTLQDLPVIAEMPEGTVRQTALGGMTVEVGQIRQGFNGETLFNGLPDNRCQCPHWGFVLKGQMRFKYADHEDVCNAGDIYFATPGHIPYLEAGCEYVEFSPTGDYDKTMEIVQRNMVS